MDKIKGFVKKHCMVFVLLGLLLVTLIVLEVKPFVVWVGNGISLLIKFLMKFMCMREYREQLIDMYSVTKVRTFNVVAFYLALCLLFVIVLAILTGIIKLVIGCFEGGINKMEGILLGKKHQKSLKYKDITLWFIKCKADILFFLNWIRFDILKIRYSYAFGQDDTKIKRARRLSLENIVSTVKSVIRFFFSVTIVHLILGGISIYTYYEKNILSFFEWFKNVMVQSEITSSQFIETFEVLAGLCLLGYIVFDIRHKANGYSDLRAERFKELVHMEEKLLDILGEMLYLLEKNIEVIAESKHFILQNGAAELSGKQCYIENTEIQFDEKNIFNGRYSDDRLHVFSDLNDMKEEFEKLCELENEFQKSSLNGSNIYLIDYQAMLMRVTHFWIPGIDNKEYMKMKFFCKSSMEEWYRNWFIVPIEENKDRERYFSESRTKKKILEASAMLDYELVRGFMLELYLKKYENRMVKRFKRINGFSRFNLN